MHKRWWLARDAVSGVIESKPRLPRRHLWAGMGRRHGAPAGPGARGLHSSNFRLNGSTLCGIGGAFRGTLGGVQGLLGGVGGV